VNLELGVGASQWALRILSIDLDSIRFLFFLND